MPFQQWDTQATTVCVTLEGGAVADIWGAPFPTAKNCTTVDHRRACARPTARNSDADMTRPGHAHLEGSCFRGKSPSSHSPVHAFCTLLKPWTLRDIEQ